MVRELEFLSWPPIRKRLALELHSEMLLRSACPGTLLQPWQFLPSYWVLPGSESLELPSSQSSLLQLLGEYPLL